MPSSCTVGREEPPKKKQRLECCHPSRCDAIPNFKLFLAEEGTNYLPQPSQVGAAAAQLGSHTGVQTVTGTCLQMVRGTQRVTV